MINEITAGSYTQHIVENSVVKVTAPWCGSCKAIHPGYVKLSEEMPHVHFFEIDADTNTDFVMNLNVKSLPTFLFYKNGLLVGRIVGNNLAGVSSELKKLTNPD